MAQYHDPLVHGWNIFLSEPKSSRARYEVQRVDESPRDFSSDDEALQFIVNNPEQALACIREALGIATQLYHIVIKEEQDS